MEYRLLVPGDSGLYLVETIRGLLPTAQRQYPNMADWSYLLAMRDDEPLAYAAYYLKSDVMIITEIGVHPAYQRKGFGSKVIAYLEYKALQDKQHGIIIQQPGEYMDFATDFGYDARDGNAFKYWGKQV